jgi:NADH dehydrogenase
MKIAVTGGTGFIGRHLAAELRARGHDVVLIARVRPGHDPEHGGGPGQVRIAAVDISDRTALGEALAGCDTVAHCAGINRQIGHQTYDVVHIDGTRNVVKAARQAGVSRITMISFLRARPRCGSHYHESKWAAEEIVRNSSLEYTILKPGMTYGRGDHMLDHLSHAIFTVPLFLGVGFRERPIRPLAVDDLVRVMVASLVDGRLPRKTAAVVGPETLTISQAARRVANSLHRPLLVLPAPVLVHYVIAWKAERMMRVPIESIAQVRILAEGVEPAYAPDPLPVDLQPVTPFDEASIRAGLPDPGPFGLRDLRLCPRSS